ncbi:flagellar hook-length control protein FliK [Alicyclobacillus acidoterrestris]|uniref:Flagellar hook-length control protein FliK n=1 Tax=Alicyclobacillus acidoterrestris (strain ATCC 49025 / DSM 3922 / CIP 106132 / NCIMB 13137 / GD3B) TaxID=1356854 RepID=T0BZN9_ALIAG|nr:flagellar hook-length control protein FliK [Alicyclobacillus acidoterrestris]EPZ46259.1 hypothetical protein N007_07125 [Alicyclobacillus acidoterrestris ATCC 49025]UNO47107.1 flagellar hook-length control protein FliK [Alicyclobacillus acidoterrestris]
MHVSAAKSSTTDPLSAGDAGKSGGTLEGAVFDDLLAAMLGTSGTLPNANLADAASTSNGGQIAGGVGSAKGKRGLTNPLMSTTGQPGMDKSSIGGRASGSNAPNGVALDDGKASTLLAPTARAGAKGDGRAGNTASVDAGASLGANASLGSNASSRSGGNGANTTLPLTFAAALVKQSPTSGVKSGQDLASAEWVAASANPAGSESIAPSTGQASSGLSATSSDPRVQAVLAQAKHAGHSKSDADSDGPSPSTGGVNDGSSAMAVGAMTSGGVSQASTSTASVSGGQTAQIDVRNPDAMAQFGHLISVKADAGDSKLQVQIVPQGMGQLDVTVTKAADGRLQVQVVASQASTFAWLNQQVPALQQNLQSQGLNVAEFQVAYDQGGGQFGSGQRGQQDSPGRKSSGAAAILSTAAVGDASFAPDAEHAGDISLSV